MCAHHHDGHTEYIDAAIVQTRNYRSCSNNKPNHKVHVFYLCRREFRILLYDHTMKYAENLNFEFLALIWRMFFNLVTTLPNSLLPSITYTETRSLILKIFSAPNDCRFSFFLLFIGTKKHDDTSNDNWFTRICTGVFNDIENVLNIYFCYCFNSNHTIHGTQFTSHFRLEMLAIFLYYCNVLQTEQLNMYIHTTYIFKIFEISSFIPFLGIMGQPSTSHSSSKEGRVVDCGVDQF